MFLYQRVHTEHGYLSAHPMRKKQRKRWNGGSVVLMNYVDFVDIYALKVIFTKRIES